MERKGTKEWTEREKGWEEKKKITYSGFLGFHLRDQKCEILRGYFILREELPYGVEFQIDFWILVGWIIPGIFI